MHKISLVVLLVSAVWSYQTHAEPYVECNFNRYSNAGDLDSLQLNVKNANEADEDSGRLGPYVVKLKHLVDVDNDIQLIGNGTEITLFYKGQKFEDLFEWAFEGTSKNFYLSHVVTGLKNDTIVYSCFLLD